MARTELAEKLELVGEMLEIEGMNELFEKFQKGITTVQYNAIVIQIGARLMKEKPITADKLISMNTGNTLDEIDKLEDGEYGKALRNAITAEVIGFFASSGTSGNKK